MAEWLRINENFKHKRFYWWYETCGEGKRMVSETEFLYLVIMRRSRHIHVRQLHSLE